MSNDESIYEYFLYHFTSSKGRRGYVLQCGDLNCINFINSFDELLQSLKDQMQTMYSDYKGKYNLAVSFEIKYPIFTVDSCVYSFEPFTEEGQTHIRNELLQMKFAITED